MNKIYIKPLVLLAILTSLIIITTYLLNDFNYPQLPQNQPSESPLVCKRLNIDGYKCVREGYTGQGFLGLTDFDNEYYVCEGLGKVALRCSEYYTPEQLQEKIRQDLNDFGGKE